MLRIRKFYSVLSVIPIALSACSSSDSSSGANDNTVNDDTGDVNQPPALSGVPPDHAMQDQVYSFTPESSDPDNDPLVFTITNMPNWATFDTATGKLSGTPSMQHVGTYSNISINVSDGQASTELSPFAIEVLSGATGSLTLSWTPPTQSADGSPLTDLAGYRLRWGTQSGDYPNLSEIDNSGTATFVVDGLAPGNYFMVLTAIDMAGNESDPSNEAMGSVQ